MFCSSCSSRVDPTDSFCSNCGQSVPKPDLTLNNNADDIQFISEFVPSSRSSSIPTRNSNQALTIASSSSSLTDKVQANKAV